MLLKRNLVRALALASAVGFLGACSGLLDVSDPQNFTDEDLDNALDAVAVGVEGDFANDLDEISYYDALLSDVWQHTGTWSGWDDVDHGRIQYSASSGDGSFAGLLRSRFASQDAQGRFRRVLGDSEANSSPLMGVVLVVEALANLNLAEHYCEAPDGQAGNSISDQAMWQQALDELTAAKAIADAAGSPNATDYGMVAQAGIARAHLNLGNLSQAAAAAAQVPTDFTYEAKFALNASNNGIVNLATFGFNNAGGMREKWWSQVDTDARQLIDPFTGELDPRVPIRHDAGVVGVDGITPHYSQWKYTNEGSDIEVLGGHEMRLIEAEVEWRGGNYQNAVDILNSLRATAGLSDHTPALTETAVRDFLLHEQFAENFMEGHRLNNLNRLGALQGLLANGDFDSAFTGVPSQDTRPAKFPMDDGEAINNPNIADDLTQRCMPTVSR